MTALKKELKNKLTEKQLALVPSSYDIVGDILIFADFPKELKNKEKLVGNILLKLHKNLKVICKKTKKYSGKFRLPKLKIIAGEKRKETEYKENNTRLKLNVEKVYFSPRSVTERKRIAGLVKSNESILVMFSGCAVYPCVIAKNAKPKEIYAVEINPTAHKYAEVNLKLNKITNVKLFCKDVKKIVPKLKKRFDRVLMPLPKTAEHFLDTALKAVKKNGTIHLYTFLEEENTTKEFAKKHLKKYIKNPKILNITKCGQFSPRVFRVCIDIKVL
jgi:tRNA (guanine37-N1)-methyltransferase|tara:strand:+ start:231 stop:1052 length:822 start_codon:yes stop_codon:yes gene_type:complete